MLKIVHQCLYHLEVVDKAHNPYLLYKIYLSRIRYKSQTPIIIQDVRNILPEEPLVTNTIEGDVSWKYSMQTNTHKKSLKAFNCCIT